MRQHLALLLGLVTLAFLHLPRPAQAAEGELVGHVFGPDGAPVAGVLVQAAGAQVRSDADGAFRLRVEEGEQPLALTVGDRTYRLQAPVLAAQSTELLLTLPAGEGELSVLVEAPTQPGESAETLDVGPLGWLEGTVRDEAGRPLSGARVFVRGQRVEAETDAQGRFRVELPVGTHALSVLRSGYASRSLSDVVVSAEGPAQVDVELVEAGLALADFNVMVPRIDGGTATLLAERADSSDVLDSVSAEEMSRRGDGSAASALKRVTGLTVVGGRYVYVRGLGERYSMTTLNGATLPSPEPDKRVVPLDLFPTAVLESVVIQKTFSPAVQGEFGGGLVQLRTRGIPDEPLFSISLSGSYNSRTTLRQGYVADGGPTDWLGWDNGYRTLPAQLTDQPIQLASRFEEGLTAEELEKIGELVPNRWGLDRATAPADWGLTAVAGRGWDLWGDARLGVMVGLTYANTWQKQRYRSEQYTLSGDELLRDSYFDFDEMTNQVRTGGIGEVAFRFNANHELRSTTLLTRDSEDLAREYIGFKRDFDLAARAQTIRWIERQLLNQQLSGHHQFPKLSDASLDWRAAFAAASRIEPDRRDLVMHPRNPVDYRDGWSLRDGGGNNQILDRGMDDKNRDQAIDLTLPLLGARKDAQTGRLGIQLQGGVNRIRRERDTVGRRFKYLVNSTPGVPSNWIYEAEPDQIFVPERIRTDGLVIDDATDSYDSYDAFQNLDAWYGMAEVAAPWGTRVMAGLRNEHSVQRIETFKPFTPDAVTEKTILQTTDRLPAFTLTQPLLPRDAALTMQLRLGYGRTVNRPDLRELSPTLYKESEGGPEIAGNPALQRALIDNFDLRWELYPSPDETVSVAWFRKDFQDPIELVQVVSATTRVTFDNVASAVNQGLELEARKSLGLFGGPGWLSSIYLSSNLAVIRSEVDVGDAVGNATFQRRPLQGQSPWILNLGLSFESPDLPVDAALLYNVAGARITQVGENGLPNLYELPVHRLDAVLSADLGEGWKLRLSGRNLLDSPSRVRLGDTDQIVQSVRSGWAVGLGVGWQLADMNGR